jgi:hypothetical protein
MRQVSPGWDVNQYEAMKRRIFCRVFIRKAGKQSADERQTLAPSLVPDQDFGDWAGEPVD